MTPSVLIVAREAAIRQQLEAFFGRRRYGVTACADLAGARAAIVLEAFSFVVTNLEPKAESMVALRREILALPVARRPLMLTFPGYDSTSHDSASALRAALAADPTFSSAAMRQPTSEYANVQDTHGFGAPPTQLASELDRAIAAEQQVLYYQPIVSLTTGQVVAWEALVRWRHSERGLIGPNELIPACEATGLILPLGRWILRQACLQAVAWRTASPRGPSRINVNVSGRQLEAPGFVQDLGNIAKEVGADPSAIALEVKESLLVDAPESMATLWQLRRHGFRVQIDGFGAGYTSLRELYRSPIEALKIDRAFVARMKPGGEDTEVVGAVAGIGTNLGMAVVAEGVETADQLAQVRDLDFDQAQGYYFSPALTAEDATALLTAGRRW